MDFFNNGFSNLIYTLIIAFFGALAKEINDKTHTNESFNVFFGEIIFHGFCGWMFALIMLKFFNWNDFISMTISGGIGGIFGFNLLKLAVNIGFKVLAGEKGQKVDRSDLNKLDEKQNTKKKK